MVGVFGDQTYTSSEEILSYKNLRRMRNTFPESAIVMPSDISLLSDSNASASRDFDECLCRLEPAAYVTRGARRISDIQSAFPDYSHSPASVPKIQKDTVIAANRVRELALPECRVRGRSG
jgi:hypothetical protein